MRYAGYSLPLSEKALCCHWKYSWNIKVLLKNCSFSAQMAEYMQPKEEDEQEQIERLPGCYLLPKSCVKNNLYILTHYKEPDMDNLQVRF